MTLKQCFIGVVLTLIMWWLIDANAALVFLGLIFLVLALGNLTNKKQEKQ